MIEPTVWACDPGQIQSTIEHLKAARLAYDSADEMPDRDDDDTGYEVVDGVATISIRGPIVAGEEGYVYEYFGVVDPEAVEQQMMDAYADDRVDKITIEMDSPGGTATYISELASTVAMIAKTMPVHVKVGGLCASAAFWIASQAKTIKGTKAAMSGSIGVYAVMVDYSEMASKAGVKVHVLASDELKGAGIPGSVITDDQLAVTAEIVDQIDADFKAAVKAGRPQIADEHLKGRVWLSPEAIEIGLIDGLVGNKLEEKMELEQAKAEISALTKQVGQLQAAVVEHKAIAPKLTEAQTQLEAAKEDAAKAIAELAEIKATEAKSSGDKLIADYQAKGLQHSKLYGADEQPKALHALAYSDPKAFAEMADDMMPTAQLPKTEVGGTEESEVSFAQSMIARADTIQKEAADRGETIDRKVAMKKAGDQLKAEEPKR